MQVICPKCGETGLLQTITPRYHRIRHTIKIPYFSSFAGKLCYNRDFTYCRVETEWAEQQLKAEKEREKECLRRILKGYL